MAAKKKRLRRIFTDVQKRHAVWLMAKQGPTITGKQLDVGGTQLNRWKKDYDPKKDPKGALPVEDAAVTKKPGPKPGAKPGPKNNGEGRVKPAAAASALQVARQLLVEALDDEIAIETATHDETIAKLQGERESIAQSAL